MAQPAKPRFTDKDWAECCDVVGNRLRFGIGKSAEATALQNRTKAEAESHFNLVFEKTMVKGKLHQRVVSFRGIALPAGGQNYNNVFKLGTQAGDKEMVLKWANNYAKFFGKEQVT